MTRVVYARVVAQGRQEFSHIYRRPRGLFISYPPPDSISTLLRNRRIAMSMPSSSPMANALGIGDQGVGGLGIPIGKLSL